MSVQTRYLLDKVIVRYTLEGMLRVSLGRDLTDQQVAALRLFQSAATRSVDLFIAPASANILGRLQSVPRFDPLIQLFLRRTQIATPTRYFTRWLQCGVNPSTISAPRRSRTRREQAESQKYLRRRVLVQRGVNTSVVPAPRRSVTGGGRPPDAAGSRTRREQAESQRYLRRRVLATGRSSDYLNNYSSGVCSASIAPW